MQWRPGGVGSVHDQTAGEERTRRSLRLRLVDALRDERLQQQPARDASGDAARTQVEERALVELTDGRAVRAFHVVGVDLELGLAVDACGIASSNRLIVRSSASLLGQPADECGCAR